jgi:amino acid adenylation domain-containing protein
VSGSQQYPVSFGQQRLWFLDQFAPGEATFAMPYAFRLEGPLDTGALQRALDALAARHGALRTRLVAFDGIPRQVVADAGSLPLEHVELPGPAAQGAPGDEEGWRAAEASALDLALRPFDLAAGPLIRARLICLAADRHLLALVMHHGIGDGRTVEILFDELSRLYRGETLPDNWMDFGDFAVWQQDRVQGDELDRQLSYWREHLRGAPHVLALAGDRPRPVSLSARGASARLALDAGTAQGLLRVAGAANATPFMVYLAGFVVLLSRYARQADMVIGTQVSGRTHAELDPVVGMFTNTLAVRFSVADDPTFAHLLARVRDTVVDALSHQELPFEKLVEDLAPDRSLAQSPLIQVQFAHQPLTPPSLDLPGITASGRALRTGTSKLDLTLLAATTAEAADLVLEYRTDLFDGPWADRFLRNLARLYEHAAQAPDTRVGDLRLIPGTPVPGPRPTDGLDLVGGLRASGALVEHPGGATTLPQVCARASRLARRLAEQGAGPDTVIGVCLGRGIGMLEAVLAAWWTGGAYVPLDPTLPEARLAVMVQDADARLIVCDGERAALARRLGGTGRSVVPIDDPAVDAADPLDPVPVPADALAYVLFTSGSTGRPKGVAVTRGGLANALAGYRRILDLSARDRVVAVTTLSFDIAVIELVLPALCGAGLVIAAAEDAREPDRLRALIERAGVTVLQATPQTWRMLLSSGGVPPGLRIRWCGGEALPRDLADQLTAPGVRLWNVYGPTETTLWATAALVGDQGPVTVGSPIDHTDVYLLDENLRPVPDGVVGEVCISGRGVARGYRGRPRLTAQVFRPDPFSAEPGARLYRTGDLGRRRDDGSLEVLGRTDHQIKLRGFRIECGEIEAALRAHPDVRQAVVVLDTRGPEPALVAYIVCRRGSPLAGPDADLLAGLRPHLRTTLPDYMIPDIAMALPALPMNPNAKVDRTALPAPDRSARTAVGHTAPRTPVEEALARIWGELLTPPATVGVHDNLFAIGGHSLTATRFVARVGDLYGVALPVHRVFATPTVAELAEAVAADPAFARNQDSAREDEFAALSDEDLDDLLRAALAQRERRRATTGAAPGTPAESAPADPKAGP